MARAANGDPAIYVELEVEPVVASSAVYARNDERVRKWRIFHEVNEGCLYVVLSTSGREGRMVAEIATWQGITRLPVRLYTTNVSNPGSEWQERAIP